MLGLADWMMMAEAHLASVTEAEVATGSATLPQPGGIDKDVA
jgi:cytochrome b pre-mRNA-processing protein 3